MRESFPSTIWLRRRFSPTKCAALCSPPAADASFSPTTWGLGKTIQAIAAAELLRRRGGIERAIVVAPASVKYQWKTEIERFSHLSAQVIDGLKPQRNKLYARPAFFNLINYELVLKDLEQIQGLGADLIILDEAQRIRNWTTATARSVKQLKSRYALVLTGTPLENKLEELYSVVEFVDGRLLGPAPQGPPAPSPLARKRLRRGTPTTIHHQPTTVESSTVTPTQRLWDLLQLRVNSSFVAFTKAKFSRLWLEASFLDGDGVSAEWDRQCGRSTAYVLPVDFDVGLRWF